MDLLRGPVRTAPDDRVLIARAATSDDRDAFRELHHRHAGALLGFSIGRVGPDAAPDIVNEAFTEAWLARRRFDPDRSTVRAWLYGIATNVVARHREREQRWLDEQARVADERRATPTVVDAPTALGLDPALASAMARLSPGQRDVLLLVSVAELTVAEAARALGIATVAARVRLHRARALLHAALDQPGDDDA